MAGITDGTVSAYSQRRSALTVERVRELLDYDRHTGALTWKPRPVTWREDRRWNTSYAGRVAGSCKKDGYRFLTILACSYPYHRVAWAHHHGCWPIGVIDHADGDLTNHRAGNLRVATISQNTANSRKRKGTGSKLKGITFSKSHRKWTATCIARGKSHFLGRYKSEEEAHDAYVTAASRLHGEFFRYE